jgi:predicted transcriptional regulator
MKNRNEEDMLISILNILKMRDKEHRIAIPYTQLLGMTGMYYNTGKHYMDKMKDMNCIEIKNAGISGANTIRRCTITDKGLTLLKLLEKRQKMLGIKFDR